ncbi:MAG: HDOD domain-containing protein [Deltaproteobacteria bacterium]|nr:HDOD domain-containing protein [Deltaproteobacteria bacterium]
MNSALELVLDRLENLPTLPAVVVELLERMKAENSSAAEIARIIALDQALTARVLRVANSALYGFPRKIATVKHAIVILGFQEVIALVAGMTAFEQFGGRQDARPGLATLWHHSVACATATRLLAGLVGYELSGQAFVAGLMHDVAKIVISQAMPEMVRAIREEGARGDLPRRAAEAMVLGLDHACLGALMAERWNLPIAIVEGIGYHHNPGAAQQCPEAAALVHLADVVAHRCGFGDEEVEDETAVSPQPEAFAQLRRLKVDFNESYLDRVAAGLEDEVERSVGFLNLRPREAAPARASQGVAHGS